MTEKKERALRRIEIATNCVPDLQACLSAYSNLLDYRIVEQGHLPESLTDIWGTPKMVGMPYGLLQPASGADVYLRFIETGNPGGFWPPVTQGWLSTEILATDPDALLTKLTQESDSAPTRARFTHVSGPIDLYPSPKSARALQMAGPAGELMYFTRILPGGSRFGLHGAKYFVDRPFIIMLGGASIADLEAFYGDALGLRIWPQEPFQIRQMSKALELPVETTYPISMARIPGRSFMLELEELPSNVERRAVPDGQLPEGLAMISFSSVPLNQLKLNYRATPRTIDLLPYDGRQVAVVEGPAGEWLELID
jgi:catechol 2,3-dioxygenase-like lactoylglutathione lyase family enzyme